MIKSFTTKKARTANRRLASLPKLWSLDILFYGESFILVEKLAFASGNVARRQNVTCNFMKTYLSILLFLTNYLLFAQTRDQLKTEKWLLKNKIPLMETNPPIGFNKFIDCQSRPAYIKHSGDSIFLYSWGGSIAETLKEFKKTAKQKDLSVFIYPSEVQSNGTVITNTLSLSLFLWRNDTLYLYDDYNSQLSRAKMEIMFMYYDKKISKKESGTLLKEIDISKYPFTPSFKTIYFTGIFASGESFQFDSIQNFKKESVRLVNRWNERDKVIFEIDLKTDTNGRYRFSADLENIERTNCKKY